jgi:nucleotide-binding universal stress UspA family protein
MSTVINKILAPTDFTDNANAAIETAADLAREFNATLILIHVVDIPSYKGVFFEGEVHTPDQMAQEFALNQLKELKGQPMFRGVKVQVGVSSGKIYKTIIEEAEKRKADLIVMGAHGLSGLEQLILGTNARRVVQYTSIPVLTIKNPIAVKNIKQIAFGSSFNQEYALSFPSMYQYMEVFNARINLVKVITPDNFETTEFSKKTIDDFANSLNHKHYNPHFVNARSIESGLSWFCRENHIDLLFMPTHGRSGIARMWSGSHTGKMGQEYTVPVFSLKMIKVKKPSGVIFPD